MSKKKSRLKFSSDSKTCTIDLDGLTYMEFSALGLDSDQEVNGYEQTKEEEE